jgi:hypothetical protein
LRFFVCGSETVTGSFFTVASSFGHHKSLNHQANNKSNPSNNGNTHQNTRQGCFFATTGSITGVVGEAGLIGFGTAACKERNGLP